MILQYLGVLIIGIIVGFLGGLFGKGGSAIATPMLSLIGIPGFISVTSPLPATIPGTFIASVEYWKSDLLDWQIIKWSLIFGVPSTILGAYLTSYTGAIPLLILTGLLVLTFGLGFLIAPREKKSDSLAQLSDSPHATILAAPVSPGFAFCRFDFRIFLQTLVDFYLHQAIAEFFMCH